MKKIKKIFPVLICCLFLISPFLALGQGGDSWLDVDYNNRTTHYGDRSVYGTSGVGGGGDGLWGIMYTVLDILDLVVVLLVALAVVFFMLGILKYISAGGDEDKAKEGKNVMIYGIIGLFVMVSFWGFVNILINTFDLDDIPPDVPYFDDYAGQTGNQKNGNGDIIDDMSGKIDEPFPDPDPKPY